MPRNKYTAKDIIRRLGEAEVELVQGQRPRASREPARGDLLKLKAWRESQPEAPEGAMSGRATRVLLARLSERMFGVRSRDAAGRGAVRGSGFGSIGRGCSEDGSIVTGGHGAPGGDALAGRREGCSSMARLASGRPDTMGDLLLAADRFRIRRKFLKVFGASFHIYDSQDRLLGYSKQKAFRLKEDIRVFTDESMATPFLTIRARQIVDFSAAYDVVDERDGRKVGAARRKGLASILRDSWELLDEQDRPLARVREDSAGMALVRRFLTNIVPQSFRVEEPTGKQVARFRQRWNPIVYTLEVEAPANDVIDRRLLLGGAILIAAVEGRQG